MEEVKKILRDEYAVIKILKDQQDTIIKTLSSITRDHEDRIRNVESAVIKSSESISTITSMTTDHEKRMRNVERYIFLAIGAVGLISFVISTIIK